MTIDQMNEIAEWLSPLDKYLSISWRWVKLAHPGLKYDARIDLSMPSQIICLYFSSEELGVTVENTEGRFELLFMTSVWEQICLRNL